MDDDIPTVPAIAVRRGRRCTVDGNCPGNTNGWETCQDTNKDGKVDTCVMTADPTPGALIDFPVMAHRIHFARKLDGWAERSNLMFPGTLGIVGNSNRFNDLSESLLPQDVRNCVTCHADSGASCSTKSPCGVGQECTGGKCVNRAWTVPSTRVCLSCHDSGAAFAHAAINTWQDQGGPIETCAVKR